MMNMNAYKSGGIAVQQAPAPQASKSVQAAQAANPPQPFPPYYYPMTPPPSGPNVPVMPTYGANVPAMPTYGANVPAMPTYGYSPFGAPGSMGGQSAPGMLPTEESFIENILRLNLGKMVTLYMTYENNSEWNAKIFRGILEAAGRDHIIISDPKTGMRFLLLMVNLDYATFDEPLQYSYPIR